MFVDQLSIYVCGGRGGDGQVSFRREKYVPRGGPSGGDGGRGGDVILVVNPGLRTLLDLHRTKQYHGSRGENGRSKGQHGANGSPVQILVPPGTLVKDRDTGELMADLKKPGDFFVVAKGGRGGRGNKRFVTPVRSAPRIAERGGRGTGRWIDLELRLLADVGLIGFPNAGKSTLLGSVSKARPKVANYPFTTLKPHLGMVFVDDTTSFVMADLPGLLEGAHKGVGLGHQFLRHIERTRLLLYVIDMGGEEGRDPYQDYQILRTEVNGYSGELATRPHHVVANKMDLPGARERLEEFQKKVSVSVHPISAIHRENVKDLIYDLSNHVASLPTPTWPKEGEENRDDSPPRFRRQRSVFFIEEVDGEYVVHGESVREIAERMNFNYYDSVVYFLQFLKRIGVNKALLRKGIGDGNVVRIGEYVFTYDMQMDGLVVD
ncbi:GTPase ObgE [Pasteuria penetrans]|uniref:GTPase ObgE n=1 Tax=Pasteuria penetrans TaxID=86005 RepID=UPI000FBB4CFF|nr:GTPase ObgE [Pasteuria penetrans]